MIDGLAVVDKPAGWTSHDVVARCRKIFGQKRVGHSGTLDPDATGVLLVGLGRVTRLLRFLTDLPKSYEGEVVLGVATSTLDASGDVVQAWDMSSVTLDQLRAAARALTGPILQVPPMVSAVKVDGKRLHDLARQGIEVERKPRPVTVHRFDIARSALVEAGSPVHPISVDCSSGTYIRTLAADLGQAVGGGAHLRNLRRTAIGSFVVADAVPLESLTPADVVSPAEALRDYPCTVVDAEGVAAVGFGRSLPVVPDIQGPYRVLDTDGRLVAVYEGSRPAVVLAPAGT
ncbi:MAG: tRNA pseudouridine(55) synthase [uncultured Acidimicrobiales bacterium]|uniref:tRNA pseudouridine synthase B n=1 Tax=uncultured Acidimicrobiales bacterium TaxID=310071 RepID=A0A6J4J3V0_9ACTN|nr:MAG: tRNA pseudouridine(55) synthase [uncultured Acidimicrobiales bacterium]